MARTQEEIFDEISTEAQNNPELSSVEANTSVMDFWHYIKNICAFCVRQLEIILDQFKAEIMAALKSDDDVGIQEWYRRVILEWQYGDEIKLKYNTPYYSLIDESKQIVKKVSISNKASGGILVKVQKEDGEKLDNTELSALVSYLEKRKIYGTLIETKSNDPNILTMNATVQLSKEIFDADGKRISDGQYVVLDSLKEYIVSAEFDTDIYLSSLSDYMNDIEGIVGFHLTACTIDGTTASLTGGKLVLPNGFGKVNETDAAFNNRMTYELI